MTTLPDFGTFLTVCMENTEYFLLTGVRTSDRPPQSESLHWVGCPLRHSIYGNRYTLFWTEGMQNSQYQNCTQLSDNTLLSTSAKNFLSIPTRIYSGVVQSTQLLACLVFWWESDCTYKTFKVIQFRYLWRNFIFKKDGARIREVSWFLITLRSIRGT